jgi:hypothetical protein
MNQLNLDEVRQYVSENIVTFHGRRNKVVSRLKLSTLIKKNPYLFRAKNIVKASELVEGTLSAFLSSSEEKMFGDFLEDLAIFIAEKTTGGHKSGANGVDLEFTEDSWHYFVSIKSGPNWGNSSQHKRLGEDLVSAVNIYKQGRRAQVDSVLGICYGKTKTARNKKYGYLKLVGQNFWTFVSGNKDLYTEIIEPLGFEAKKHNDDYIEALGAATNRLEELFIKKYCNENKSINWSKLVQANSGNYDLDKHGLG